MKHLLFILIACSLGLSALLANAEEPFPITAQDYCHFLKCAALSDPHCFYEERMATDQTCIVREGTPGNYAYVVLPGKENQLVSYLNWHDAACYAYWKKQEEDHLSDDLTRSSNGFQVDNAAQNSDQELKSNIVHFSLINDKALDDGSLPSQEPPSWISYMMIPFFILGESGQAVSKASPDHISVPSEEGLHLKEEPLNRMGISNMNLAAAGSIANHTISSAPSEETQALSTVPTGKLGATSLVQVNPNLKLRDDLENRTSKNANKSPLLSKVLTRFIENNNRTDSIPKKKEEYQRELRILPPDSDRALMLKALIPTLEKATSYQNALIGHFLKNVEPHDSEKEALKAFRIAEYAMMINDRPNKIELIAKQIEEDYEDLTEYQDKLLEVEAQIELQPIQLTGLLQSHRHLNKAVELQRTLIEQRASYAQLLDPPCEQLNTTTQAKVDQHEWKLVETEALVSREYLLLQANTARNLGQPDKANYLYSASFALFHAAGEAQKPPELRNPDVIEVFQRAADLHQEAVNVWHPDQPLKATYLNNAGAALFQAAGEAQKPPAHRNPEAIDLFQRTAILLQEAASTRNLGLFDKANSFNQVGFALFQAAKEAQKPPELRNPDVINLFQRAADLHQEAANAWDQNQPGKARHLHKAGNALFQVAQETQKPPELRNPDVIEIFQRVLNLHQEGDSALNLGLPLKAFYLYREGHALYQAAQEMQKSAPNPEVIARFIKEAEEFEEKANSSSSCIIS